MQHNLSNFQSKNNQRLANEQFDQQPDPTDVIALLVAFLYIYVCLGSSLLHILCYVADVITTSWLPLCGIFLYLRWSLGERSSYLNQVMLSVCLSVFEWLLRQRHKAFAIDFLVLLL